MTQLTLERRQQGFTIIELAIVTVIVGALAGLAVPTYLGYLDKARITRSIAEIRYISRAVDSYKTAYDVYPNTLADAGAGDIMDPWGNPYAYLNIAAMSLPGASSGGSGGSGGATGGTGGTGGTTGTGGSGGTSTSGGTAPSSTTTGHGPGAWLWILPEEAYAAQSAGTGPSARPRMDRFLHPINSDYDLYSMGKDGETVLPLTARQSHDDVIRANDGSFVGLAVEF